jgi:hypothetical protein
MAGSSRRNPGNLNNSIHVLGQAMAANRHAPGSAGGPVRVNSLLIFRLLACRRAVLSASGPLKAAARRRLATPFGHWPSHQRFTLVSQTPADRFKLDEKWPFWPQALELINF